MRLLDCPIDNLSLDETLDRVEEFIRTGEPHQHMAVNVDKLMKVRADPRLREIVERCDLISVDGQPLVWASRLLGKPVKARVTGIDLMEALVARAARKGWRPYFLGARSEIVARLIDQYHRRYPQLEIAGARDGYWDVAEEAVVVETIRSTKPDILFVAMSSPKKEFFIQQHLLRLDIPFVMGVGGSFDVIAGFTRRAPRLFRTMGLEWFWRFVQEPRRMWKRYFVDDLKFVKLLIQALRQSRRRS